MSSQTKLTDLIRYYGDELMVIFIYIGWTVHVQYNCYLNLGRFVFNVFTTGEPLLVALLFYGLKSLAVWYRSNRDLEKDRKENPEHYEHA